MTDRRRQLQLQLWLVALDRYELMLRVKIARQRNSFIKANADSYENNPLPAWLMDWHRRETAKILSEHYQQVALHFGTQALKQVKSRRIETKSATFLNLMMEWVGREALRKATMIAATDSDDVRNAIRRGLDEGLGVAEIAKGIRESTSLTTYRASTVARTETHAAATFGSIESVRDAEQQLGIVMNKEWLATTDDRTRDAHLAADGQIVRTNEMFNVGGEMMDRPGDPSASAENVINCRCGIAYSEA
jgi:SPP1 gp7 family putative phage head morphogenesis protein